MPPDTTGPGGVSGSPWSTVTPRRAPVTPRVCTPGSEAALPLVEQVRAILQRGQPSHVNLCGPAGSGKSVALAHLASMLPANAPVLLIDGKVDPSSGAQAARLTIYTSEPVARHAGPDAAVL